MNKKKSNTPKKTVQSESHIIRRRLSFHRQGILRAQEDLAYKINLVKDLEARLAEIEAESGE